MSFDFKSASPAKLLLPNASEMSMHYGGNCAMCRRWIKHRNAGGRGFRYYYRDETSAKVIMLCAPTYGCMRDTKVLYLEHVRMCPTCDLTNQLGTLCWRCQDQTYPI